MTDRTYLVTEYCSHCESEVEMRWNTDTDGYKAFCPYCGKRLMLCNECQHDKVEVKPVTKTTSKSTEKIRVNRNTHDDYVRRSYTLSEEHVRKLQLMKTFCDNTNITYNELIEKSIDLLWKHEYQDKYIQLLKTIG